MNYIIKHIPTGLYFLGNGAPNYTINPKKAKTFCKNIADTTINSMKVISFYGDTLIEKICIKNGFEIGQKKNFSAKSKNCFKIDINKKDLEIIKYEEI